MKHRQEQFISIHAPSRERLKPLMCKGSGKNFNPRSLTGATAEYAPGRIKVKVFQSTLPYGSDSEYTEDSCLKLRISIHAPLRERLDFYWPSFAHLGISIHAPLRERRDISQLRVISGNFNPRSLTGATSP